MSSYYNYGHFIGKGPSRVKSHDVCALNYTLLSCSSMANTIWSQESIIIKFQFMKWTHVQSRKISLKFNKCWMWACDVSQFWPNMLPHLIVKVLLPLQVLPPGWMTLGRAARFTVVTVSFKNVFSSPSLRQIPALSVVAMTTLHRHRGCLAFYPITSIPKYTFELFLACEESFTTRDSCWTASTSSLR